MPLVPINITGQQYQSRSGQLSNQVTQNFYAELTEDPFGKAKYVLQPTPGMERIAGIGAGTCRGLHEHLGVLYLVNGTTLYTITSSWVGTSRGTIAGTDRVIFTPIGTSIVIVANAGANIYQWNGSTLSAITDGDLETPQSATTLNNQVIYQGDNDRFCTSDVGDATTINALNYATAESAADDLVRVFAFNQRLYLFGDKTIEVWWNSGQGNPPFDRVEGGIYQVGLDAKHSVAANDNRLYWLGDDLQVYTLSEGGLSVVSNIAMHGKLSNYGTTSDAIAWTFTMQGQNFYCLSFPTQNVTWLFNEKTGWTALSSGIAGGRSLANAYAYAYGQHIVASYNDAYLYRWDTSTYLDDFGSIVRIRDSAPLHGGLYGAPGARVEQNDLRLIMEVGTGLDTPYAYTKTASNYLTTPDSPSLDFLSTTYDIDVRVKVWRADWSASGALMFQGTSGNWGFVFNQSATGNMVLSVYTDGTASVTATADSAPGFDNLTVGWVRVLWDQSESECTFYTSTVERIDADDTDWDQLGAVKTLSATMFDSTAVVSVGSGVVGKIYEAILINPVTGLSILWMDADDWSTGSTFTASGNDATGETWTVPSQIEMVGSGSFPSIKLAISDDGGNTWSDEIEANIGAASDFFREVRWNSLGSFVDGRILRIKATDRVFTSIHGATSYIEVGI